MSGVATVLRPAVEIVGVHTDLGHEQIRGNLELPAEGDGVSGFWVPLTGWLIAPSGQSVDVVISDRWRTLRRLGRRVTRPDIADAFPDVEGAAQSGFSIALNATELPEQFEVWLSAAVGDELMRFALIRGERRRFEPAASPALAPLAVTTLGRTGSTLMMTLLSCHPAIWAHLPPSCDSRPFAHALDAAIALSAPGSRMQLLDSSPGNGDWWTEHEPVPVAQLMTLDPRMREVLFGLPIEGLLRAGVERAALFARDLAFAADRPSVAFAAEKSHPGHVPRLLHELSRDTREIFLVRDFRDVLTSIFAFNAKRGYAAFGRENVRSDQEFVERFAHDVERLAADWAQRHESAHLVRYEDLVAAPDAVLSEVLSYLELDTPSDEIARIVDNANRALAEISSTHVTASAPSASTGRWERDLPDEVRDLANELLTPSLRGFGYG